MEIPTACIPGINSVQPVNDPPLPDRTEGVPPVRSEFTSLLDREINNTGDSKVPENPVDETGPPINQKTVNEASEETAGNSEGPPSVSHCMVSENEDGEDTEVPDSGAGSPMKSGPTHEDELKMGELLFKMLNAIAEADEADIEDLPDDLFAEAENCEMLEESSAAPVAPPAPELPSEDGLKTRALLYELSNASQTANNINPFDNLSGEKDLPAAKLPAENGLKTGALLYELLTTSEESDKDGPQPGQTADNRQVDRAADEDSFMTALTQNTDDETEGADAGNTDTPGQTDKHMNQFKAVLPPEGNIEAAKKSSDAEGRQTTQQGPEQNLKVETTSDSGNQVSQQNVCLQSGKAADGPIPGQTARPAGFTQVLDNVVYVLKGNNRLAVSVEHDILGKLDISLSMEKGALNVQINTSERQTREFIENNIQSIMDSLAKEGVTIGGFSVALKERRDHERPVFAQGGDGYREKEIIRTEEINSGKRGLVNVFA
ncbi:MAG: flagellar hook-length control protein FliK [Nitrospirae bacterium]|nr:flagellar hook-length control protein FliK [Nitrospirota bacterium]